MKISIHSSGKSECKKVMSGKSNNNTRGAYTQFVFRLVANLREPSDKTRIQLEILEIPSPM